MMKMRSKQETHMEMTQCHKEDEMHRMCYDQNEIRSTNADGTYYDDIML